MKTLVIFLVIISAAFRAAGQDLPNLENFLEIGRDPKIVYYVDIKDVIRHNPRFATVNVLAANYEMAEDGKKYRINKIAWILSTFRVDCDARTGQRLKDVGLWNGVPVEEIYIDPKIDKPNKSRKLWYAIDAVCEPAAVPVAVPGKVSGGYQWTGGNGCNLFVGGSAEKVCCQNHDYAYRTGGGMRQRWQADSNLFKCVWRRNKILAPFVFVGANVGGLVAWHYGKRRDLGPIRPLPPAAWSTPEQPINFDRGELWDERNAQF